MKQTSVKSATHKGWHRVALLSALIFGSTTASATELLNSSYDVSRELFTALNPGFQQQWEQQNPGDKLTIKQSHAGSSKQALAILQGLKADVVTYNQVTDVQILHDRGNLIPADWQARLPNNSSPFYSQHHVTHQIRGRNNHIHPLIRIEIANIFNIRCAF